MEDSKHREKNRAQLRRERENENHHNEIVLAAEKLFISRGFTKSTMKKIAEEAGFAKGTVYNYFKNKEDLYLAVASKCIQKLNDYYRKAISDSNSGLNQLRAFGFAYYNFYKEFPGYADLLHNIETIKSNISYNSILERKNSNKHLTRSEREYLAQVEIMREILMKTVNEAISKKEIRSDIAPNVIGVVLSNLTSNAVSDLVRREKFYKTYGLDGKNMLSIIFDLIIEGLKFKSTEKD